MKRILIILMILFFLPTLFISGCKENETDTRNLLDFKNAFIQAGYTLENEDEPYYTMIGAIGGILFYVDNHVVKIYQYENTASYEKALKDYPQIKDAPKNGFYIAESSSNDLLIFFSNIEK